MLEHASRENRLVRMGSHIQSLLVDVRGDQIHDSRNQPAASQLSLEIVIPTLLPLLPDLTSCTFDGALYGETLSQLVRISTLKRLELHANDWYLQQSCSYVDESRTWVWRRCSDLVLDFRVLANLKSLQTLKLGRLQHHEARGLAEGVARLRLIDLEIHSSPWVKDEDPRYYIAGGKKYDWPLMFFLYVLVHRYRPNLLPRGFPSTLETLVLRDRFHLFGNATRQIYLRAACRNCQSLRRVESTYPTREQASHFFLIFEWRPIEERFGTTTMGSLEVPEQSLGQIYNGIAEFRHLPSPGPWNFAFVRDPDDVIESAEGCAKRRSKDSTGLRAAVR